MFCFSCVGNKWTLSYSESQCRFVATALRTMCCNEPSVGKHPPGSLLDCSTRLLVNMVESRGFACLLAASQLAGGGGPGILRTLVGPEDLTRLLPGRGCGGGVSGTLRMLLKEGWTVVVVGVCGIR